MQSPSTRPHLQTLSPIRDQVVKHMSLRSIFTQTTTQVRQTEGECSWQKRIEWAKTSQQGNKISGWYQNETVAKWALLSNDCSDSKSHPDMYKNSLTELLSVWVKCKFTFAPIWMNGSGLVTPAHGSTPYLVSHGWLGKWHLVTRSQVCLHWRGASWHHAPFSPTEAS